MRTPHLLKKTTATNRPRRVIFFDTETTHYAVNSETVRHSLKLGYAMFCRYDGVSGYQFWKDYLIQDINGFWLWLDSVCKKKSLTYLVAHNITFDLTIMAAFERLPRLGWKLESFYSKGMVSMYRWNNQGRRIIMLDNSNFFAGKLEYWGKLFEIPKLSVDFENVTDDNLLDYCKRDVEIMRVAWSQWTQFLDTNRCGAFKPTIASTAFNTFRHRFMTHKIHIHDNELGIELERQSYKGGRTECLFVGKPKAKKFYYLDINNMYGWVLATQEFPAGIWGAKDSASLYELAYKLKRYAVIADVTVNVNDNWFPYKLNDHTCYPLGEFRTTLTTPELKLAINKGWLVDVHQIAHYRKHKLFEPYITEFREHRERYQKEGSAGFETIVKLFVNGLYGKFGQTSLKQEKIGDCDSATFMREQVYNVKEKVYYDHVYLGGSIFRERRDGESFHSFPAIAAHVTAHARLYLLWFMKQIPKGHVYYMDTDSLIVDEIGFQALKFYINPAQMGMLKIELESDWIQINAPKDYEMAGRIRRKGIKQNAVEIGEGIYKQDQWSRLNGIIKHSYSGTYDVKQIEKRRRGVIWSGKVKPSGWVDPHFLIDGQLPLAFPQLQPIERS